MNVPNANISESWQIRYLDKTVRYIEAFRRTYWDHGGVCKQIDAFFKEHGNVKTVCELGSGGGTNLFWFSKHGYQCLGLERNAESVEISAEAAKRKNLDTKFQEACFSEPLNIKQHDAILSLFVPISMPDMVNLAENAAPAVRPGGYFICMLLGVLPEYVDRNTALERNMEHCVVDGDPVIRFNFFSKQGPLIDYEGVYIVNSEGGAKMFTDTDKYHLLEPGERLEFPNHLYRHVSRLPIFGKPHQAPPMTYEIVDIYQRL